jgi:hypothetical protein
MRNKKTITILSLIAFVGMGMAAIKPVPSIYKNLQILPKDISAQKLDSIMNSYNVALGVNCKFCHVPIKNMPDSLDYASDAEHMKEEARKMMRMNIMINTNYFYFDITERPQYLKTVNCNTCHRGEAFPEQ